MSAAPAERPSFDDQPIGYALTDQGWDATSRPRTGRLPAEPLLRQIWLRGGDYAVGVRIGSAEKRALERARETGTLTVRAADHLSTQLLGMCPLELWGGAYFTA